PAFLPLVLRVALPISARLVLVFLLRARGGLLGLGLLGGLGLGLDRGVIDDGGGLAAHEVARHQLLVDHLLDLLGVLAVILLHLLDRKRARLNSSHVSL